MSKKKEVMKEGRKEGWKEGRKKERKGKEGIGYSCTLSITRPMLICFPGIMDV